MVVKTFNDDVINRLINQAEPELSKYIKAQKSVIENGKRLTSEAVSKIKKLHAENDRLKAELADSLPLQKVREMVDYCDAHRGDCENYDCYVSCPFQKLCEFFGDLTSCKDDDTVSKLEGYVRESLRIYTHWS